MDSVIRVLRNDSPWEQVVNENNLAVFAEEAVEFTARLSSTILQNRLVKRFPELAALGFWLRRANILAMRKHFTNRIVSDEIKLPRGLVFHIAPANVDTIFVYSWIISLLCGNRNILRISTRQSTQLQYLLDDLEYTLDAPGSLPISKRLSLLRYPANDQITGSISSKIDARVIWGGNATVEHIRSISIPPTAIDFPFPNKWSLSVIDLRYWDSLGDAQKKVIASQFANDSYQFGQAACSSPRAVIWLDQYGKRRDMSDFWSMVSDQLHGLHNFADVDFVNKLVVSDCYASKKMVKSSKAHIDNRIFRLQFSIDEIGTIISEEMHCDGGFFFETVVDDLGEILSRVGRKVQTISYSGVAKNDWREILQDVNPIGIDRIVPIGNALEFSYSWDGLDLFDAFTRRVVVR